MLETIEEMSVSVREWDEWRSERLTKACFGVLIHHATKKLETILKAETEENFPELFADPARQARYAALRGRIDGFNDLREALKLSLRELIDDPNDEIESTHEKDKS